MTTPSDSGADARTSTDAPAEPAGGASFSARNRSATASSATGRGRAGSLSMRFLESSPPVGMWQATGNALAAAPTPMEIRRGEYSHDGWDAPLQRRNSMSSNEGRLSRVSSARSTAQTPGSLGRTNTFLDTHKEAEEEHAAVPTTGASSSKPQAKTAQKPADAAEDDDDPFSKFIGRGKIDNQSYVPRPKAEKPDIDPLEDEVDDDEADSLEDLDPRRPVKRNSALPKKFIDPTGDRVAMPEVDKAVTTTKPASSPSQTSKEITPAGPDENGVYPTGYKFPPKHTWGEATLIGLKAFWKFTITPLGFLVVIYGLNVVAWGGMLFLLLIGGGSEFMCYPVGGPPGYKNCNDINAPRRIWIEIDSQILNALFCVTGFGLIPWRFRDLYYLMKFRIWHKQDSLRKLAGINRAWFRLPGSEELPADLPGDAISDCDTNPTIPLPVSKAPDPPLTGFRAPATKLWKLDYVIWAYVMNTFLQVVLSSFMWSYNRYTRPSWSTGTFVALACIVAGLGGLMCFLEGKKVKAVEGIPVPEAEMREDVTKDIEKGETGESVRVEKDEEKGKGRDDTVR